MNQAVFTGNAGKDADYKESARGAYVRFPIGVSVKKKEEFETMWVNCIMFGEQAEKRKDIKKGDRLLVGGRLSLDKGQDGNNYLNMFVFNIEDIKKASDRQEEKKKEWDPLDDDIPF